MPKIGERKIATMVKISQDTYNKLHYLALPSETRDETLNRILTEFPDLDRKIKIYEKEILKNAST